MQAGTELFAARVSTASTVEAIAERAGVNKAMINYHFGGKRGLYKAILRETFEELGADGSTAIAERAGDARREQIADVHRLRLELGTTRRAGLPRALPARGALGGPGRPTRGLRRLGRSSSSVMRASCDAACRTARFRPWTRC